MSTIGRHVNIDGEVSSDDDLTIEGCVTGLVLVRGATLIVESSARLEADVRARHVIVRGAIQGAISASERIELASSSSVEGSLSADQIAIAEGARFNGYIDMNRRTIAARIAEYRASRAAGE
jgi:cytoskeletal protein CcmA (bactofilin family)